MRKPIAPLHLPRAKFLRSLSAGFVAVAVAGVASVAGERDASASGYLTSRFGADHGSPAMANPYAVYFNPAAMGGTTGTQITGDLAVILRFASYKRTPDALSDQTLADPNNMSEEAQRYRSANTGTARLTNVLPLGYLGVTTDFGSKRSPIRAGYAFYVPFGGIAQWDKREGAIANDPAAPGAQDGVQRWHNISGQLLSMYNTLAISYTPVEDLKLSFGANVSFVHHGVNTIRARNIPQNDDTITSGNQLVEGRTRFEASGNNLSAALGVYWEPRSDWKLGVSYTSQPGFGQMRLKGELHAQAGTSGAVNPPQPVDFLQSYPDVVRFGAGYKATKKLDVRADLEYVRWSVMDRQCVVAPGADCNVTPDGSGDGLKIILNIPRNWQDSLGARAGVGYFLTENTELFGSAAFTTSAVPKSGVDASAIDAFRIYGTAGVRQLLGDHLALAASMNVIHFLTVDTKGSSNTNNLNNPSKSPSADGIYKSNILFLNVNGTVRF